MVCESVQYGTYSQSVINENLNSSMSCSRKKDYLYCIIVIAAFNLTPSHFQFSEDRPEQRLRQCAVVVVHQEFAFPCSNHDMYKSVVVDSPHGDMPNLSYAPRFNACDGKQLDMIGTCRKGVEPFRMDPM